MRPPPQRLRSSRLCSCQLHREALSRPEYSMISVPMGRSLRYIAGLTCEADCEKTAAHIRHAFRVELCRRASPGLGTTTKASIGVRAPAGVPRRALGTAEVPERRQIRRTGAAPLSQKSINFCRGTSMHDAEVCAGTSLPTIKLVDGSRGLLGRGSRFQCLQGSKDPEREHGPIPCSMHG